MRLKIPPDYPDDAIPEPVHHGRGALSNGRAASTARNASARPTAGRPNRLARPSKDDWLPQRGRDARCHPHHSRAQHLARRSVRPLDQSLSRLRARLHLLLRAAHPRVSRAVARPRFRDQDPVQAGRRQAVPARPARTSPIVAMGGTPIPISRSSAGWKSRAILRVLGEFRNPVGIITKNHWSRATSICSATSPSATRPKCSCR